MKLLVLSDLHVEFGHWQPPSEAVEAVDLVVLAGDIGLHTRGLDWARQAFGGKRLLYVAGNHEFYGEEVHGLLQELRRRAGEFDIAFLENETIVIDGVRFLGCVLWTDFSLFGEGKWREEAMQRAQRGMNDFRFVRIGPVSFRPEDSVFLHRESRAWLEKRIAEPFDGSTVVVTHHCPSWESVAWRYREDLMSAAFASCLDPLVGQSDLWIHGHTHDSFDYRFGKCRVVCNPRGYPMGEGSENPDFDPGLVVEVENTYQDN